MNTLTVGELIEQLQELDPDLPVLISSQYGDHWNSIIASEIRTVDIEEAEVEWSTYHDSWKLPKSGYSNEEDPQVAVVIGPRP